LFFKIVKKKVDINLEKTIKFETTAEGVEGAEAGYQRERNSTISNSVSSCSSCCTVVYLECLRITPFLSDYYYQDYYYLNHEFESDDHGEESGLGIISIFFLF